MKPCGHKTDHRDPGCRVCELYVTDEKYRALWDGTLPVAVEQSECRYFGLAVRRPGQVRDWHECNHPEWPLGELVCPCRGCNSTCPGYTPAE